RKAQYVVELAHAEVGVHLVGDGPDQLECEENDRKGDAVRQLDRDDVAAIDADAAQEGGATLHLVLERPVGDAPLPVDEDLAVGMGLGPARENVEERLAAPMPFLAPALGEVWFHDRGEAHAGCSRQRMPRSRPPSTWMVVPVM